jgi:hypothetical protein
METQICYRFHKTPALVFILYQTNPDCTDIYCCFNFHFNIIFPMIRPTKARGPQVAHACVIYLFAGDTVLTL